APRDEGAGRAARGGADTSGARRGRAPGAPAPLQGRAAAEEAAATARKTFEEGTLADTLPTVEIARRDLGEGLGVLAAFHRAGLVASNSEARRQIKAGGLRVNDVTVMDEKLELTPQDLGPEGVVKLSVGKKRHVLIKPV